MDKIRESVPDIAFVSKIDGKVKEVIQSLKFDVEFSHEELLIVFVGDVAQHHRRAPATGHWKFVQEGRCGHKIWIRGIDSWQRNRDKVFVHLLTLAVASNPLIGGPLGICSVDSSTCRLG